MKKIELAKKLVSMMKAIRPQLDERVALVSVSRMTSREIEKAIKGMEV